MEPTRFSSNHKFFFGFQLCFYITPPFLIAEVQITWLELERDPFVAQAQVPLSLFRDNEHLEEYQQRVRELFLEGDATVKLMLLQAGQQMANVATMAAYDVGLNAWGGMSREKLASLIIQDRNKEMGAEIRESLGVEATRGKHSQWTGLGLTLALRGIVKELKRQRRTYAVVAEKMQKGYGNKAPASGEALRKLLKHHEIDWADIKNAESGG